MKVPGVRMWLEEEGSDYNSHKKKKTKKKKKKTRRKKPCVFPGVGSQPH